ncbi:MAG: hypothetical protein IIA14_02500, partial [SAR324 cluster bacterium]|nr:hypothetical protein [SAR324 cluster bacterium]
MSDPSKFMQPPPVQGLLVGFAGGRLWRFLFGERGLPRLAFYLPLAFMVLFLILPLALTVVWSVFPR